MCYNEYEADLYEDICLECGQDEPTHEDPRVSPMDVGACLCLDCCRNAYIEAIKEHEAEIATLKKELDEIGGSWRGP